MGKLLQLSVSWNGVTLQPRTIVAVSSLLKPVLNRERTSTRTENEKRTDVQKTKTEQNTRRKSENKCGTGVKRSKTENKRMKKVEKICSEKKYKCRKQEQKRNAENM